MTRFRLAVLPGDGIGPEVVAEAVKVLRAIETTAEHRFELTEDVVGGAAIDAYGTPIRKETIALAKRSDAVLFGSVGGPKWDDPKAQVRPEQAILGLRTALGTFANLRPARMQPALVHLSPLKPEIVQGADVLFVRELVAGTYFARPKKYRQDARGGWRAVDTTAYTDFQVERTVRLAFEFAPPHGRQVVMQPIIHQCLSRLFRVRRTPSRWQKFGESAVQRPSNSDSG